MSNANWRNTAELVGITAIVITLFMVAYELRQNTTASQQVAAATYASSTRETLLFLASSPDFSSILVKNFDGQELSEEEDVRVLNFHRSMLRTWQDTHYQYLSGNLDEDFWFAELKFLKLTNEDLLEKDITPIWY